MNSRVQILTCLALGLLATIAFNENQASKSSTIQFRLPKLSDLNAIKISQTGRNDIRLIRQNNGWTLGSGNTEISERAHTSMADLMATPLSMDMDLGPVETLDKYGLGVHSLTVQFKGELTQTIRVGKVVNDRLTFIYDERSQHVYRARGNVRRVFDRARIDWRERQLFSIDYASVVSVASKTKLKQTWSASRPDSDSLWTFIDPEDMDASQDAIAAVVNTFVQARAASFMDGSQPFVEERTLKIITKSGQTYKLSLGKPTIAGQLPVRRITTVNGRNQTSPWIAMLPKHQAIFLNPTLDDLRNKRVFGFKEESIDRITWTGAETFQLSKRNDSWIVDWDKKQKTLDRAAADSYRENFANLRALKIQLIRPENPFMKSSFTLSVYLKNGTEERVYIGQKYGAGRRIQTHSKPNQVMILSKASMDILVPNVRNLFD